MKHFATLFTCIITAGTITFAQDKKEKALPPPPPPPKIEVVRFIPPVTEINEYYKRNPSVTEVYRNNKKNLVVKLKSNTEEEYDFTNEKMKNAFTEKYGTPPAALPPPLPEPNKSWQ